MRSVRVLGLALAAGLLASQAHAGVPAGASFTSACAGLGFGGGGNAGDNVGLLTNNPGGASCSSQTSVVGGSAASSAINSGVSGGVSFNNSASSSAGPKSVHLTATNNSKPAADFPAGIANGGFTDQFTQNTGTHGRLDHPDRRQRHAGRHRAGRRRHARRRGILQWEPAYRADGPT